MPDGTWSEVTSASDEKAQKEQIRTAMSATREGRGYIARQR